MIDALDFFIERLFGLQAISQRARRLPELSLPFGEFGKSLLDPIEAICPVGYGAKKMSEIPFIGIRKIGAAESFWRCHVAESTESSTSRLCSQDLYGLMACNPLHCLSQKVGSGRNPVPRRRSGGMWQGNQVKRA